MGLAATHCFRRIWIVMLVLIAGVGVLCSAVGAQAAGTKAREHKARSCPPAAASPPPVSPAVGPAQAMTLSEILAVPNRPDPAMEGRVVVVEGYVLRAMAVPSKVAGCPVPGGKTYRLHLRPHKVAALKGRVSIRKSVVALVPAELLRGLVDSHGRARPLRRKHVVLVGRLTFAASRAGQLYRTQGSRWELLGVSQFSACPNGRCPDLSGLSPVTNTATESR